MKSEIVQKWLVSQEQFFEQQILEILRRELGNSIGVLEKSKLDVIHAFVKEITSIQKMRYNILRDDFPE